MSAKAKRAGSQAAPHPGSGATLTEKEDNEILVAQALLQQTMLCQTQERLEASNAAYGQLREDHQRLQELRQHEEREGYELSELYRRQTVAKNEQLEAMQQEAAAAGQRAQQAEAAAAQSEAKLREEFEAERQQMGAGASALQKQLDSLIIFQQDKEVLEEELRRMRQDKFKVEEELGAKVRALQLRFIELGYGPDGLADGMVAGKGTEDGEDGGLFLEADMHRLLAHSRKIEHDMKQYGQEAEELQKEMHALETERAALLRDMRLKDEMEKQYAKRGTLQAREIRDAHSKIGTLERGLAQMAADFEMEKAALEQQLRAQLADAVNEQNSLRRLLRLRTKELRHLRHLAQEVLLQRSDVEAFLVSSIQQVRGEIATASASKGPGHQNQQQQQQPAVQPLSASASYAISVLSGEPSTLDRALTRAAASSNPGACAGGACSPPAQGAVQAAVGTAGASGQVDIKELSWEDRERILRLLFAKINKAAQRSVVPPMQRTAALPEAQAESPPAALRGLATEAGPAGLA